MAGRPRRRRSSSASFIESGHSHIRYSKESFILKPAPQDMPDSDWPCYVLTDATIYRNDGKTLANPLLVNVQGPMVVRGFLEEVEVDDDNSSNLVRSSVKSGYIEIPHSEGYSIGDGPLVLWVSGASGWFEIRPSTKYQPIYHQIVEAITLYYSAFEVYEKYEAQCGQRKKRNWPSPPTLDDIFLSYAVRTGDGILRDEVEALCHKWAEFLIAHFAKEADLDWNLTHFAKWLRDAHPDTEKRIADIAKGIIPPQPPPEPQHSDEGKVLHKRGSTLVKRSIEKQDSRSQPPKAYVSRKAKTSETPIPLPEKYRQHVQATSVKSSPAPVETSRRTATETAAAGGDADSPVDRLLRALQEIHEETDIKKTPQSKLHSMLYFKCKIRQYNMAKDVTSFYAKELLPRLGPEWKDTPWYEWLKDTATRPWVPGEFTTAEMIPSMTIRRAKVKRQQPGPSNRPATELPPSLNLKARTRSEVQKESEGESDDEDVTALQALPPMRSRRSGKAAGLRLVSSGKKRPHSDMDELVVQSRRGRKSAKTIHRETMDDDVQEDASDEEVGVDEDLGVGSRLPLPEGAVRLVVHAERLPSTTPTGPDGTWTCDQEGCTYVVRSADDEDGQQLIQEHFREHEEQAAKINLALKESRGHMPINHLLDKIRAISRAVLKERGTLNGQPVPAPVKRRLLI